MGKAAFTGIDFPATERARSCLPPKEPEQKPNLWIGATGKVLNMFFNFLNQDY